MVEACAMVLFAPPCTGLDRPVLVPQAGHTGAIDGVLFSEDGSLLATASEADASVRLWDAATGRLRAILTGFIAVGGPEMALSPDGTRAATGCWDRAARLWDARTGRLIALMPGLDVSGLAFSPDSRYLAVARCMSVTPWELRPTFEIRDAHSGALVAELSRGDGWTSTPVFAAGGRVLAFAHEPDARSTPLLEICQGVGGERILHDVPARRWAISPSGSLLATWAADDGLRLWDLGAGRVRPALDIGRAGVEQLAAGDAVLAAVMAGGAVRLWETAGGRPLPAPAEVARSIAFSPDGQSIRLHGDDTLTEWSVRARRVAAAYTGLREPYAMSPDGRRLAAATEYGSIVVRAAGGGREVPLLPTCACIGLASAFSRDGRWLATTHEDGSLHVWGLEPVALQAALRGHRREGGCVAVAPNGSLVTTDGPGGEVWLWDLPARRRRVLADGSARVTGLAFSPAGSQLVAGRDDGTVTVWEMPGGTAGATLAAHDKAVKVLAFTPDGSRLLTAGRDAEVSLWEMPAGVHHAAFTIHSPPVAWAALAPDGGEALVLDDNASGERWDLRGPEPAGSVGWVSLGEDDPIEAFGYSTVGRRLAFRTRNQEVWITDRERKDARPEPARGDLLQFPPEVVLPVTLAGAAAQLRDPLDGEVRLTLLPIAPGDDAEWLAYTPEGYLDGSPAGLACVTWNVGGRILPAEAHLDEFHRPDLVQEALRRLRWPDG